MARRCVSRNRRAATIGVAVALVALTRRTADAQSKYPYVGCYKDERDRAMEFNTNTKEVDIESCATQCLARSYDFMGLQYAHECFCGNEYAMYGRVDTKDPADNNFRCNMTLADEPDIEAGGWWTMSIYDLRAAVASDEDLGLNLIAGGSASVGEGTGSAHEDEGTGAGGTTDVTEGGLGPVKTGSRAFTVVNNCKQTIRVASTGGRITFGDGKDPSAKSNCDAWGPSAVYNPGPLGIGCYWNLPPEASGNKDGFLAPGKSFRYPLYETDSDVRWSGTIWASTHCAEVDGCATGVCYSPDTDFVCPAYVGPGGPTTKAEFTLSDSKKDYYDVSNIDGSNLPMMIEPDDPVYPPAGKSGKDHIHKYQCGNPGAPEGYVHHEGLSACSWKYDLTVPQIEGDMSTFLRLVLPASYEDTVKCTSDDDCSGLTCGVHPQRWANGAYRGGVEMGSCGKHVAWVTAGGACAGGWVNGEFPDAHPFYCGKTVKNGMRANMYGCHGGEWAHSGYTPGANSDACGCPLWEDPPYSLKCPSISECNGINPDWVKEAMPWAAHQKKACPTAYTFPYDDQTSTFTCFDGEGPGSSADYVNTQSYTITFCPGDTESAMFP